MKRKYYSFFSVLSVLCMVIFSGCGKGTGGDYYMKFKANGTDVNYTVQGSLYGNFVNNSTAQHTALITGFTATSSMGLNIFDSAAVTTKGYSGYTIGGGALLGVQLVYSDKTGSSYSSDNTAGDSISITEITSTTLRGNFKGLVKQKGKSDIAISDGEFFVKRAN